VAKIATSRTLTIAAGFLGLGASAALAGPVNYGLVGTVGLPVSSVNNQGGNFTAFDIGYVDPLTGYYYIADRSNASVDIINGATNMVLGQAGVGVFGGQNATTAQSGPDGVVVVNNGSGATLYAGNGNTSLVPNGIKAPSSTLISFSVSNPASPTLLSTLSTGGINRVDEMAYSGLGNANPGANNLLLAANNAEPGPPTGSLPFATLVNVSTGTVVKGNITIPNTPPPSAGGGLEQPVFDKATGTFFVSVPAFNGAGNPGGLAQIDASGNVIGTYDFGVLSGGGITGCAPTGLAIGGSGNLLVGCGSKQTVIFNPTANGGAGAIVATLSGVSGSDEVYYNPTTGDFYATGVDASGNRVIAVISDTNTPQILQSINLTALGAGTVNAHSVAVDPLNNEVFVPLQGSITGGLQDTLCPRGCVAVFASTVPEPATWLMVLAGLLGVVGASGARRRFASLG